MTADAPDPPGAPRAAGHARRTATRVLAWGVAPIAIALVAAAVGQQRARHFRGKPLAATEALSPPARHEVESATARAVANVTWAFGSLEALQKMFRAELDRLPESDPVARARVLLRFGVVDTNYDGQAALFAQVCQHDANLCDLDRLREAAKHEVQARFVPPGNVLPLSLAGGRHPPVSGAPGPK